MMGFML